MDKTIHIWHDKAGRVLAWGEGGNDKKSPLQAIPLVKRNQKVITVSVAEKMLPELHSTHSVDPKSGRLVARKRKSAPVT